MTLGKMMLYVAIAAVILTLAIGFSYRKSRTTFQWAMSFPQSAAGLLFIVSGWVKAIDPLGTAYKMEEYFGYFASVFQGTWLGFLAPVFPVLKQYAVGFSVAVIVVEIVLGLMLLMGAWRKFTSWAFLLLILFFTFLTGFTYLSGYVPEGVGFFQVSQWGKFVETNMKVTDCGCFGDFIKIKPKTSFLKDVFLLIPALLFVVFSRHMHQVFTPATRTTIVGLAIGSFTIYCLSNFVWDIPHTDFRPFKVGVNIAERKALEMEAMAKVEVLAYKLKNKSTGQVVELPYEQFLAEYLQYPKEEWEYEQVLSESEVPQTKISEFQLEDINNNEVTEELLSAPGYSFMIVAYDLHSVPRQETRIVNDTIYQLDTILSGPEPSIERSVKEVVSREQRFTIYDWRPKYMDKWTSIVNPVLEEAEKEGVAAFALTSFVSDPAILEDFRHATQSAYPFYVADELLLKTIIRSNPGIVLLKEGTIVMKWHYRQLPSFEKIKEKYMTE
jgi:uncharacterized membrane protein YphA (DoxX/SURF4 family)